MQNLVFSLHLFKRLKSSCIQELPVMLKRRHCNNLTTRQMNKQANASAKSKELQPTAKVDTVAAHSLLLQPLNSICLVSSNNHFYELDKV